MQFYSKLLMILALSFITSAASAEQIELAQTNKEMCLHTCIEQHGADKKQACAVQCGFAGGALGKGQRQQVDCGTQYKRCLANCETGDKNCRKQCRQQRTTCY